MALMTRIIMMMALITRIKTMMALMTRIIMMMASARALATAVAVTKMATQQATGLRWRLCCLSSKKCQAKLEDGDVCKTLDPESCAPQPPPAHCE